MDRSAAYTKLIHLASIESGRYLPLVPHGSEMHRSKLRLLIVVVTSVSGFGRTANIIYTTQLSYCTNFSIRLEGRSYNVYLFKTKIRKSDTFFSS